MSLVFAALARLISGLNLLKKYKSWTMTTAATMNGSILHFRFLNFIVKIYLFVSAQTKEFSNRYLMI
jgi:hypothetical protein